MDSEVTTLPGFGEECFRAVFPSPCNQNVILITSNHCLHIRMLSASQQGGYVFS
jgi:hypothetical protein